MTRKEVHSLFQDPDHKQASPWTYSNIASLYVKRNNIFGKCYGFLCQTKACKTHVGCRKSWRWTVFAFRSCIFFPSVFLLTLVLNFILSHVFFQRTWRVEHLYSPHNPLRPSRNGFVLVTLYYSTVSPLSCFGNISYPMERFNLLPLTGKTISKSIWERRMSKSLQNKQEWILIEEYCPGRKWGYGFWRRENILFLKYPIFVNII